MCCGFTEDQLRVCAVCGAIKWYHEPGRAYVSTILPHDFTEVFKVRFGEKQKVLSKFYSVRRK